MLVANPKVPANSLKELVALAKSQPNKLNYGHTGLGVAPHMVGEMLRLGAGIEFALIPYKGDAPLVPALLTAEVDMSFLPPTGVVEHVKAGRLKALAVTGNARGSAFPDVPTTTEAGQPEAAYVGWVSLFGPGGTPRDILAKVSSETARVLKLADIAARLPGWGGEAAGTSPDEFAAKYRADIARYARIIKAANVPLVE